MKHNTYRLQRWGAALAVVGALGGGLAACGSDDKDSTASTTSAQSSGGGEAGRAQAFLARYAKAPTEIPVTTPLKAKPPAGKTVTYLQCDAAQCKVIGDAMRKAADAIGWRYQVLNYKLANPASLAAAMQQALQQKPVAVAFSASPYPVWQSQVKRFKAAGTALIPIALGPAPIDDTVVTNLNGPTDVKLAAQIMANWFIADSKASGKAVLYSVPDLPAIKLYQDDFVAAVKQGCSRCSVNVATTTVPDALGGKSNQAIVSALQKDRSVKYVVLANYPLTVGLPSSLTAAGFKDVKIAGSYAGRADQALIKQGREVAATPQYLNMFGWMAVDAAARKQQGQPLNADDYLSGSALLTSKSIGTPTDSYDQPPDYQQRFKTLWKVGT